MGQEADNQEIVKENDSSLDESLNNQPEETDKNASSQQADDEPNDSGDLEITLGDESLTSNEEEKEAPSWVKELRKSHKESQKKNKDLQKRLNELESVKEGAEELKLGKKPTLEDVGYDEDKYEVAMSEWYGKKVKVDGRTREINEKNQKQKESWEGRLREFDKMKNELGVSDYEDVEDVISDNFTETQQGIIIHGSENPALAFYAIGKNAKRAKELASIKDPIKLAFAIAKLEKDLKVTKKKRPPNPESRVKGSASSSTDSALTKLREQASKTGDYSAVMAYKRKLK